jgi:hypothetical protein
MLDAPFCSKWIFDVELLARLVDIRRRGRGIPVREAIYEMPLTQWKDVGGSKVRPKDFVWALFDLAVIYWTYLRPGAAGHGSAVPPLTVSPSGGPDVDQSISEPSTGAPGPRAAVRESARHGKAA